MAADDDKATHREERMLNEESWMLPDSSDTESNQRISIMTRDVTRRVRENSAEANHVGL